MKTNNVFLLYIGIHTMSYYWSITAADDSYVAAVVEYSPVPGNIEENERNFEELLAKAKEKGAELIVFPEYGLYSNQGEQVFDIGSALPLKTTPCDANDTVQAVKQLSCAARRYGLYTIFNVPDMISCAELEKVVEETCEGKQLQFNTNVVLDRNGVVIAKHRTYHQFGRGNSTNRPKKPMVTHFDTDFGVRFGVLNGFEILFEYPARFLLKDLGIKHIISTSAWSAQLPTLVGVQYFYGWSYAHHVNLLVAGLNDIELGSSGSGIFGGRGGMVNTLTTDTNGTQLLVGRLPKSGPGPMMVRSSLVIGGDVPSTGLSLLAVLEAGQHKLVEGSFQSEICHRELCCLFNVSYHTADTSSFYRAFVFDGVSNFSGMTTLGTQICLLVLCEHRGVDSCATRALNTGYFTTLAISGNFNSNHSLQTPSTLRQEGSLVPLQPWLFNHTAACNQTVCKNKIEMRQPLSQLVTFGIYGRNFAKDGQEPDELLTDFEKSRRDYGAGPTPHYDYTYSLFSVLIGLLCVLIFRS